MPLIINFVEKYFGKKPITSFNPDETVAIGAALRGETLFNNSPYIESLHLIDVIPLNIGVMVGIDQNFDVILKRNTYIPCNNKKIYHPLFDNQSEVEIKIYEGTNKFVKDNVLLGNFSLEITPKKAIESKIEVSFEIDEHLILHVTAEQISEGKSQKVSIKKKYHLLTSEELELEKKKIENCKIIHMNENEKKIYSKIINKQKEFFSEEKIINISKKEIDEFILLIEGYFSEFKMSDNNLHLMSILFRLYELLISKTDITFDQLEEKMTKYFCQISEIDIFYILNFITKSKSEKKFQEELIISISSFFSEYGKLYLSNNFNENKHISYGLFQLSLNLFDNLFVQNKELKNNQQIIELIKENEQYLKYIKITDISLKINEIYKKNNTDEKYLNQIIELYQMIANLIKDKNEIYYIKSFETLYKLGDNYNYLLNVLDIMNSFNAFIQYIESNDIFNKNQFDRKLKELNKYYTECNNVNQEYFKNDFDFDNYNKIEKEITNMYNEDKVNKNLTNFTHFILENYPPLTLSRTIDEFKKDPSIKILVACYSKSYTKIYKQLIYKEKIREKIHSLVSEMFNNNIQLESTENNTEANDGEETDNEGDNNDENDDESLITNYASNTK